MLWALGVQAHLVLVGYIPPEKTQGQPRYQHVFAQAYQPSIDGHLGRWVAVDPSLWQTRQGDVQLCSVWPLCSTPSDAGPAQKKKTKGTRRAND